jgi:Tfp pilus assembly protein PilO
MALTEGPTTFDERSQRLATLGRLLHAAGMLPLIVGAVVYFFAYRAPLSVEEKQLRERVASITQQVQNANTIRRDLEETTALLQQQRSRAEEVRERIPDAPGESEFLQLASDAANKGGVSMRDFVPGKATHFDTFSQLDISLQCAGAYESICRFLDQLEDVPRVARVISLDLDATAQQEVYPLQFVVRLYFGIRPGGTPGDRAASSPETASAERSQDVTWPSTRLTPVAVGGEHNG